MFLLYLGDVRHVQRTRTLKSFSEQGSKELLPEGAPF
jgi:hypothetical protein